MLERLKEYFGNLPEFKAAINRSYKSHSRGFYVYAPPLQVKSFNKTKNPVKELVEYITRYADYPPIAESSVLDADYEKNTVPFIMNRMKMISVR